LYVLSGDDHSPRYVFIHHTSGFDRQKPVKTGKMRQNAAKTAVCFWGTSARTYFRHVITKHTLIT
jgi:hypothetical protein